MEKIKNLPKPYLVGAGVIVVLLFVIIGLLASGNKKPVAETPKQVQANQDIQEAIPTVDSSVKVDFEQLPGNKINIEVMSLPKGTEGIDYEISYDTSDKGLQGAIGMLEIAGGKAAPDEDIFMGTCSSGTCIPHKVAGPIKLTLRFNGSYGEQLFEKEYENE